MPETPPNCSLCTARRHIIHEWPHWTLALNENQATLGRVFFVLNRHETDISNLTLDEQAALWQALGQVKAALDSLFHPDHYNFVFLMNLDPHVHAHLYPRYKEVRHFAGETFTDAHYGRHYDPAEQRPLDLLIANYLTAFIRDAVTAQGAKP